MNLLAKDKYRTKILQHVLQQSDHSSLDDSLLGSPMNRQFDNLENENSHCQNRYSSLMFQKVSKIKPIISDAQEIPLSRQSHSYSNIVPSKQSSLNSNLQISNPNLKSSHKRTTKTIPSGKNLIPSFNHPRTQVHLHKQPYVYHQKLPIISLSDQCNEDFLTKLQIDNKNNSSPNKQNNPHDINVINQSETKTKKYRFIPAFKVAEVIKSKKQQQLNREIVQHQLGTNMGNQSENIDQLVNTKENFDQTHRSKGSREMMDFLESARNKLFSNIKAYPIVEPEKVTNQQKNIGEDGPKQQNQSETQITIPPQSQQTFKIQIQVSAKKSCELSLTLSSDPQKISKNFIISNKHELSTFTDYQIKKLQELLSKKILKEIEKQKELFEMQKPKENLKMIRQSFEKTIEDQRFQKGLFRDQKKKKIVQSDTMKQHITQGIKDYKILKKKKPEINFLQYSHVYVQNIEHPYSEVQKQQYQPTRYQGKETNEFLEQTLQLRKLVSFKPGIDLQAFKDIQKEKVSLDGYLNSPHQLITYRVGQRQTQQNDQHNQPLYESNEDEIKIQQQISHFPLSASILDNPNTKKTVKTLEIGASRILSKSQSKIINKLKVQHQQQQSPIDYTKIPSQPTQKQLPFPQPPLYRPHPAKSPCHSPLLSTSPQINSISSQIVSRIGKQNILQSLKQKELNRRQIIIKEKQAKEIQLIQECSFKPKINNLSKSIDKNKKQKIKIGDLIDENKPAITQNIRKSSFIAIKHPYEDLQAQVQPHKGQSQQLINPTTSLSKSHYLKQIPRHQQLYGRHKQIQARKEYTRQKSIEQISFKPEINKISNKIIETKRNSLNNSTIYDQSISNSFSRHHNTYKKSQQKRSSLHCDNLARDDESQSHNPNHKRKSMNLSRNLEGLEIGEYLYKQAMRMKKKKQAVQQVKIQSFKALQKSQQIVNRLKQTRLSECFFELLNVESENSCGEFQFVLKPECINFQDEKFLKTHLKHLVPLLQELTQLNTSLTRAQFIQAGLNLLAHLSPDQKAQFLQRRASSPQPDPGSRYKLLMNKLSRQLVEKKQHYLQDIYHRGIVYKKNVKDKLQLDMEQKVRKELEMCTFKPKINSLGHSTN